MPTSIHLKIRQAEAGDLSTAIIKLKSGWVVAGDVQPLEGYCILLCDPVATDFNSLDETRRAQYALDMGRVGDALKDVTGAYRINYETWGNLDPALHTHIVPRFMSEPDEKRILPPRQAYDWGKGRPFNAKADEEFVRRMREILKRWI